MAKGSAHALVNVIAGGAISPTLAIVGKVPLEQAAVFAAGYLAGLIINPNLDIRRFTHAQRIMRRSGGRLGRLLSGMWFALWWPYARVIPWHCHPLSHLPVIGLPFSNSNHFVIIQKLNPCP